MNIISLHPVAMPNSLGGVGITMYGLGDDGKPYVWNPKEQDWQVVK